jgi:dTDP-4-amino-4,6-dideoxygalactose transaminase
MRIEYPYFNQSSIKKVKQVLKSGKVNYWTGNECKKFEKEFSIYHDVRYSLSV